MITILSALVFLLSFRVRSRISLELELVALRHQVAVLRRQRKGRLRLFFTDRLLWVWLYRAWPQVLNAMVLVKPTTVIQWHRKGFRLYWRWRSRRLGRPKMGTEIRDLIRQMSLANPLWGAPASTANCSSSASRSAKPRSADTCRVDRKSPPRPGVAFCTTTMINMAAINMFVVATATFRLLYALIVLGHNRSSSHRIITSPIMPPTRSRTLAKSLEPLT
jgi:hypothetical protein